MFSKGEEMKLKVFMIGNYVIMALKKKSQRYMKNKKENRNKNRNKNEKNYIWIY